VTSYDGTLRCVPLGPEPKAEVEINFDIPPYDEMKIKWREEFKSRVVVINPQREPTEMIKDVQVLATISLLAKELSPDLHKSFFSGINSTAKEILPEELAVEFSPPVSVRQ
jgi:hypothetical protein